MNAVKRKAQKRADDVSHVILKFAHNGIFI